MSKKGVLLKRKNLDTEEEREKRSRLNDNTKSINQTFANLSQFGDVPLDAYHVKEEKVLRAGVIERVVIKNFKCHSYLEFNLHNCINFILGRNGSGKSAVMDAIILCLGGRAQATGRQANAKTFIKTNMDKAELSITMLNEGDDAFKPELYGNRITIERKIAGESGTSTYKILDSNGKMVTTKKGEIDNIADQFNIQVDNPVCFLNQETSKNFLNSSNNADKYKLFMKASQLESMKQIQEEIERERVNSCNLIKDKEAYLPKLEEELFEWEDKYKKTQSGEKLRKKQMELAIEASWAAVIESEKKLDTLSRDIKVFEKSKEKHEEKVTESSVAYEQAKERFESIKSQMDTIKTLSTDLNLKKDTVTKAFRDIKVQFQKIQLDTKGWQRTISIREADKKKLEEKCNEEKQKNMNDINEKKAEHERQLQQVKQKIIELEHQESTKKNEINMFKTSVERDHKQHTDLGYKLNSKEKEIQRLKGEVANLNASKNDQIQKFGPHIVSLTNEIKQMYDNKRFKQMPIGPLGMHIEPKDYRWALAIEQCLSGLVSTFICGSYDDERTLQQAITRSIREANKRPRIVVTDFNSLRYNIAQYRPEVSEHPTVYEMINFKNDIVANVLVDQRKIESILLLPDHQIGRQIMERNLPRNCSEAFLLNGDQVYGYPSYKVYACKQKNSEFLMKDVQSAIEDKLKEMRIVADDVNLMKKESNDLRATIDKNNTMVRQMEKSVEEISRKLSNTKYELRTLLEVIFPEPGDVAVIEEEIHKCEQEIDELKEKIRQREAESAEVIRAYQEAEKEKNECDAELQQKGEEIDKFSREFEQIGDLIHSSKRNMDHYKNSLNDVEKKFKEKDALLKEEQEKLNKQLEIANQLSNNQRVETRRSFKTIDTEYQQVTKQLEMTKNLNGNEEEITKKYIEMRDKFHAIKEEINRQKLFLKKLKQIVQEREQSTHTFIQSKSVRCAMDFSNLIASRDYNGTLKFDHINQRLEIIVHPNKSKENFDARDLKSLSGGERSFSTVSFLLALWTIVESPLLFLDEFDVFMDQINRRFAMELILNAAKERLSGQYVFLTPQECGYIQPDEYVKIYKMPDPKRTIDN